MPCFPGGIDFRFGEGKSKGLGRLRFEEQLRMKQPGTEPETREDTNHLRIDMEFTGWQTFSTAIPKELLPSKGRGKK